MVIIQPEMHRHSASFTFEEYQWLDMPYFHLLPVMESHHWEWETRLPDITSKAFAEWCDYVARDRCARLKNDPNLVGYFFTDCPVWIHSSEGNSWKAPIFDPEMEKTESGRREIFNTSTIYYKTIVESIRRYDPNHLICGAYIKNHARRYGLLDLHDQEEETTQGIKQVNFEQQEWVREQSR